MSFCHEYASYRGITFFPDMLVFSKGEERGKKPKPKQTKNPTKKHNRQRAVLAIVMVGNLTLSTLPEEHFGRFVASFGFQMGWSFKNVTVAVI